MQAHTLEYYQLKKHLPSLGGKLTYNSSPPYYSRSGCIYYLRYTTVIYMVVYPQQSVDEYFIKPYYHWPGAMGAKWH